MLTNNKTKKTKSINQESVIYALSFVLYAALAILVFIYSVRFLSQMINSTLSAPQNQELEAKYGQLDLENYTLVANKLNLAKPGVSTESQANPINEAPAPVKDSALKVTPEIINDNLINTDTTTKIDTLVKTVASSTASTSEVVAPKNNSTTTAVIPTPKPSIVINNSTTKSGLASELKNKLQAAGFTVLRTGNSRPSLANTIIKIKASLSPNSEYLAAIKKIVALEYDFISAPLEDSANSEIEIIIGNK